MGIKFGFVVVGCGKLVVKVFLLVFIVVKYDGVCVGVSLCVCVWGLEFEFGGWLGLMFLVFGCLFVGGYFRILGGIDF